MPRPLRVKKWQLGLFSRFKLRQLDLLCPCNGQNVNLPAIWQAAEK